MSTVNPHDDALIAAARAVLDRSVDRLDPEIAVKLQRARIQALDARPWPVRWLLAGGLVTASLAALAVTLVLSRPVPVVPVHHVDDFEIVTTSEAMDFYDEIEFYRWLADHHGET